MILINKDTKQEMTLDESSKQYGKYICPFHDDKDPSLSVKDNETFYCHSCKATGVARSESANQEFHNQLEQKKQNQTSDIDLWEMDEDDMKWLAEPVPAKAEAEVIADDNPSVAEDNPPTEEDNPPTEEDNPWDDADWDNKRIHTYTDEDGNNLKKLLVVRTKKDGRKLFSVKRWEDGKWEKGLTYTDGSKVPLYPYKIQNLLSQSSDAILLVEGEKDVDNLHSIGIPNVTTYGSSNLPKMDERNISYFRDKKVYIVVDNDKSGYKYGREMGNFLFNIASAVKVCFMPNLEEKEDVSDYIAKYNPTLDELKRVMISNSFLYEECSDRLNKFEDEFESLLSINEVLGKHKRFPINSFPRKIRNYGLVQSEATNTYIEYHTLGLMTGLFGLLQGKFQLDVYNGWKAYPSGVFVLVGDSGESKSHPIKTAISKIKEYDEEYIETYEQQKKAFEQHLESKKSMKGKNASITYVPDDDGWDAVGNQEPKMPKRRPYITTRFTMEGLRESLRHNKKGLVAHINEMDTLFGMMGAYKQGGKGDDASFFMNIIDGEDTLVDLAKESIRLKAPRCSLIGTIQRKTVKGLYTEKTKDLGFAYRFLFAQPWETKYYTVKILSAEERAKIFKVKSKVEELYDTIRDYVIDTDNEVGEMEEVNWQTDEAFRCFMDFNNNYVNGLRRAYSNIDGDIGGVLSKIVSFTPKMALGLQLIKFFSGETDTKDVELATVRDAIEVMKYFIYNNYIILKTTGDEEADKDYLFFLDYMKRYRVKGKKMSVSKVRQRKRKGYLLEKDIVDAVNRLVAQDKAVWLEENKEFEIK